MEILQSAQYRHFCHGLCRFLCRFFFLNLLIINTLFFLCRKCRFLREIVIGKKIKGGKYIYSSIGEKICHFRQSVVYQHFNRHES